MKNLFKRGFTLIELLVVIAIIGILASIVITNLSSSRSKAKDGSAKVSLASMRAQAETLADSNGNYPFDLCARADGLSSLVTAVGGNVGAANVACVPATVTSGTITAWAVGAMLSDSSYFCADSTGYSGVATAQPTEASPVCPQS